MLTSLRPPPQCPWCSHWLFCLAALRPGPKPASHALRSPREAHAKHAKRAKPARSARSRAKRAKRARSRAKGAREVYAGRAKRARGACARRARPRGIILGNASSRVLAGLCIIVVQHQYWKCLLSGDGWVVLHGSTTRVLEMPPLG